MTLEIDRKVRIQFFRILQKDRRTECTTIEVGNEGLSDRCSLICRVFSQEEEVQKQNLEKVSSAI